jgi:hypothetical protein
MNSIFAAQTRVCAYPLTRNAMFRRPRMLHFALAAGQHQFNVRTLVSATPKSEKRELMLKNQWQGLGPHKETIRPAALPPSEVEVDTSASATYVCSYSTNVSHVCIPGMSIVSRQCWTLTLPGAPSRWDPPSTPFEFDSSSPSPPQRRASTPFSEANCASLRKVNSDFDFSDVDVYSNRGLLFKLFELCRGGASGPLRLNAYLLHNTLVLSSMVPVNSDLPTIGGIG